jgi:hypothetical protein
VNKAPPPVLKRSAPASLPNPLNYRSAAVDTKIDREIKRRWRRLHLKMTIGAVGSILAAILILTLILIVRYGWLAAYFLR